jgi:MFS family permease
VGEATFVTIAPHLWPISFRKKAREDLWNFLSRDSGGYGGWIFAGGKLGPHHGWRFPFYIAAAPGFVLALAMLLIPEPERGKYDTVQELPWRAKEHQGLLAATCATSGIGWGRIQRLWQQPLAWR